MITSRRILKKPVVTEKSNNVMEKLQRYTFIVDKTATKIEIKNEVEQFFNVKVLEVRTIVVPGKRKTKMTKKGIIEGMKSSYKKAIITLVEGQSIDLYSNN
jgi:large subunit ribosomal protein L23